MALVKISELPAASALTGAEVFPFVQSGNTKKGVTGNIVFNVRNYGAVGNGTTDDTSALQACIDAAISDGLISTTRLGLGTIFLPAGTYRITAPLLIQSVLGIAVQGEGDSSALYVDADMATALDLNGVALSSFSDFRISGSAGSVVDRALWLRWGADIGRSTANNAFTNINVRNLEYKRGFQIGEDAATNQVDTDTWINCHAVGTWESPEATLYQYGFYVGSGVTSNNLLHAFFGCGANGNRYNLYNAATEVAWFGGILQHAETDILVGSAGYTKVSGFRSEHSTRLLDTIGPAGYPANVSLENIDYSPLDLHADNNVIKWNLGGHLSVSNLSIMAATGKAPKITAANAGAPYTIHLDSVTSTTAVESFASVFTGSKLMVTNYVQIDSSGATIASTSFVSNGSLYLSDDTGAITYGLKPIAGVGVGSIGKLVADTQGAGGGIQLYDDGVGHIVRNGGSSRPIQFDNWQFVNMPRAQFYEFIDAAYISSNDLRLKNTADSTIVQVNATGLGFYGVAPVARPAAIIDADGTLADITTKFNSLLTKLEALGLLTP